LRLTAIILFVSAGLCQAAPHATGHWEGVTQIPGHDLKLTDKQNVDAVAFV
jgi:hypothetical protein